MATMTPAAPRRPRRPGSASPTVDAIRNWLENADWTEEAYFALPESNQIVELSDAKLIIPDMPDAYSLVDAHYQQTGHCTTGQVAVSALLPDLTVDVAGLFGGLDPTDQS